MHFRAESDLISHQPVRLSGVACQGSFPRSNVNVMTSKHESDTDGEVLTPAQVRAVFGVTARTLDRWKARGLLRPTHFTVGGHARYARADVDELKARAATDATGRRSVTDPDRGATDPESLLLVVLGATAVGVFSAAVYWFSPLVAAAALVLLAAVRASAVARRRRIEAKAAQIEHRLTAGPARARLDWQTVYEANAFHNRDTAAALRLARARIAATTPGRVPTQRSRRS